MKTVVSFLLCFLLISIEGYCQQESVVLVVSNHGKVNRIINKSNKASISAGTVIKGSSTIELEKGSSVLLYSSGNFREIKKSGKVNLKKLFADQPSVTSLNFDDYFGEYLNASIEIVNSLNQNKEFSGSKFLKGDGWGVTDPKAGKGGWGVTDPKAGKGGWGVTDPKAGKGGWGVTDPKAGKGGWGVTDPKSGKGGWGESFQTIEPATVGGNYRNSEVVFKWIKQAGASGYTFYVIDENLNAVYNKQTSDTSLTVNLRDLNLSNEKSYYWQVTSENAKLEVSAPVGFKIISDEEYDEVKNAIKESEIYENADASTRSLMEAVAMEHVKLYYDANTILEQLTKTQPNNNLFRISYAGFCMRIGQYAKAKMLLK